MDIKEFFSNIKNTFISLYEKIKEFCLKNKLISLIISLLIVVIILCLILLGVTVKHKKVVKTNDPVILTQPLVTPEGPVLPKDYNITRKTEKNWSEEEVSEWFTVPSEKEVDALSRSNDNMVNEIIGAAP